MSDSKTFEHVLFWYRRDLRTRDNKGMSQACRQSNQVSAIFVFDENILQKLDDKEDKRIVYIHRSVQELDSFFQKRDSKLIVKHGDPIKIIVDVAQKLGVEAVFTNEDYEPYARDRDEEVAKRLDKQGISFRTFKDQVIFAKDEVLTNDGDPYKVFTPYKNKWLEKFERKLASDQTYQRYNYTPYNDVKSLIEPWRYKDIGFTDGELWVDAGEEAAQNRLKRFAKHVSEYHERRNYPADDQGTSGLSVCLRFGTISIRECVRMALSKKDKGHQTWLSELIWRDFYQMVLWHHPYVVDVAFQEKYEKLTWPGKEEHFKKWCEGQTGYPIVDAAMRCLNQKGFMHNRLRMIVAMFLTKDLLVDWRKGERYFAKKLLDYDLASNNGGWQWSASTGVDAQPYFRIFNPWTQSKKFDPEGEFIRQFCPELMELPKKYIHEPHETPLAIQKEKGCVVGKDYPNPIVDHSEMRKKALELFKKHS